MPISIVNTHPRHESCLLRPMALAVVLVLGCTHPLWGGEDFEVDHSDTAPRQRQAGAIELEEMVVTAKRIPEAVRALARNVTVVTSQDIERMPARSVLDVLGREPSVDTRSLFGTSKQTTVDLRGMGDTAVSSVLVMVDGIRLNAPDLGGPDLSSIPLEQIERIEIVRGTGSVTYGDGAVGGVIHIITKKKAPQRVLGATSSYGSFDTFQAGAGYTDTFRDWALSVHASHFDSDGYRDNGFLRKNDGRIFLSHGKGDPLVVTATGTLHEDVYGLPGPVRKEDADSGERRTGTDRPDDAGRTTDKTATLGMELDLKKWGRFQAHRGYRFKENSYVIGYNPLLAKSEQTDSIDENMKSFDATYEVRLPRGGLEHRVTVGVDHYASDYVREEVSRNERKNARVESLGLFATGDMALGADLRLQLGYRTNLYDGRYRIDRHVVFGAEKRWVNGTPFDLDWTNEAWEGGVVYYPVPAVDLFAGASTSFRVPNLGELADAEPGLHPQKGTHFELGARARYKAVAQCSVTLFHIRIEDEIQYGEDPETRIATNRNFDEETLRRGIEVEVRVYPVPSLFMKAGYTHTEAVFEKSERRIPLVPGNKASLGVEWQPLDWALLAVTGVWVDERIDGNDRSNTLYDRLDPYMVWDAKAAFTYGKVKVFAGADNLLDTYYSSVAYSETYYPMPGRSLYAGVEWTF